MYFGKFESQYQVFFCALHYILKSDLIAPEAIHTYFQRSLWMLQTLIAETSKCFQSVMGTSENQHKPKVLLPKGTLLEIFLKAILIKFSFVLGLFQSWVRCSFDNKLCYKSLGRSQKDINHV